jgi:hypothetical protein
MHNVCLPSTQLALLILARVHVELVLFATTPTTKFTSAPATTKATTATSGGSIGDVILARLSKLPALLMGQQLSVELGN